MFDWISLAEFTRQEDNGSESGIVTMWFAVSVILFTKLQTVSVSTWRNVADCQMQFSLFFLLLLHFCVANVSKLNYLRRLAQVNLLMFATASPNNDNHSNYCNRKQGGQTAHMCSSVTSAASTSLFNVYRQTYALLTKLAELCEHLAWIFLSVSPPGLFLFTESFSENFKLL